MPIYTYTAVRKSGERYSGTAEARDRFGVYELIRKEGGAPLSVSEGGSDNTEPFLTKLERFVSSVSLEDKVVVTRNLASMLEAGLSLPRALDVLARETKSPKLKQVFTDVGGRIAKGSSLHVAFASHPAIFPPFMVSMVRAGEESGSLPASLKSVGIQFERVYGLRKKIIGAMIYPAIVVSAMVGIAVLMLIFVVPTLKSTFDELNADLPASTQFIISASDAFVLHPLLVVSVLLLVVASGIAFTRTNIGRRLIGTVVLYLPVIKVIARESNAARTARTLSSLLSAGVDALSSLEITRDVVGNARFRAVLDEALQDVEKGKALSEVFKRHEDLYPPLVGEMAAVGEETGELSGMLLQVAEFYEDEVERKTKDLSTIVEPILMIIIGSGVGFFAFSMILPIYSISGSV